MRWAAVPVPPAAAELRLAGIPSPLAELLAQRGLGDAGSAERFLAPSLAQLTPTSELGALASAAARLHAAASNGERVLLVGDYDVDGVSSTALLAASLGALGAAVTTRLPRRDGEGYGLQPIHVEQAVEAGARLLVAVDSGTSAQPAWDLATSLGVELVIVDHHLPPTGVDPAPAPGRWLVNPRLSSASTAAAESTAAGLAARLAAELFTAAGREAPWEGLLRLAALGTVADVAPLVGDNRVIVALGLRAMAASPSPGLRELQRLAGTRSPISASDVAFRLAPRLNAAGRLADAGAALELLMTRDPDRARALAAQLERWNAERQHLERRILDGARGQLGGSEELPPIVVLSSPDWHRGVVGVAAARLARELHRPTILLAEEGEEATGSGRSVAGLPLHELIAPSSGSLRRFGGHAQAVGLTVAVDQIDRLREQWQSSAASWRERLSTRELRYDLELPLAAVGPALVRSLDRLSPFGSGNPEPVFLFRECVAATPPAEFGRGHLRFSVASESARSPVVPVVAWNGFERWGPGLPPRLEILASIENDPRYGVRLRLVDVRGFSPSND